MPRSPRWSRTALVAVTTIVVAACGGTTASPAASAPASAGAATAAPTPAESQAAFTSTVYPETGEAPCGVAPYTGSMKKITAVDRLTVQFDLCGPDPAFLPKVAFQVFGIQDADYLAAHMADKTILDQPNGTGPYKLSEWSKGNRMVFEA
ncbi:MAG TPA: ABC transporter substrate-binding protein, partial [Candidatus Limnocylindrales bacterium]